MAFSALRLHRYSSLSCSFLNGKGNEGGTAGSDETRPWWTGIFVPPGRALDPYDLAVTDGAPVGIDTELLVPASSAAKQTGMVIPY